MKACTNNNGVIYDSRLSAQRILALEGVISMEDVSKGT